MGDNGEQGPGRDAVRRQQDAWKRRDAAERAQQGPRPRSWEGAAVPPRIRRRRGPILGRLFGRRRGGGGS